MNVVTGLKRIVTPLSGSNIGIVNIQKETGQYHKCDKTFKLMCFRFGRKKTFLIGCMASCLFGMVRSFSPSYIWYLIFIFCEMILQSGIYSSAFILGNQTIYFYYQNILSFILPAAKPPGLRHPPLFYLFVPITENPVVLYCNLRSWTPAFLLRSYQSA